MSDATGKGSWLVVEELFERGDAAFVDELRKVDNADRLGAFASRWYGDSRSSAHQFLFDYLGRPLNAFRHEVLVKRLFKLAESAGDDVVMAHFLVLFDRSIRRERRKRSHTESAQVKNQDAAQAQLRQWSAEGADVTNAYEFLGRFFLSGRWVHEVLQTPRGTAMPRNLETVTRDPWTGLQVKVTDLMIKLGLTGRPPLGLQDLPERYRRKLERFRLFTIHTRHYLRRRAWRYFRKLGKQCPERYVSAVMVALKQYVDDDVADGLELLDNWGLIHILFHHCPALMAKTNGWTLAADHTLAELAPAPSYEPLWKTTPRALLELLKEAPCRPVRQWAIHLIRRDQSALLSTLPLEELLAFLSHEDPEVVALAAEVLRNARGLEAIPLERWLALLETPNPTALETICALMQQHVRPEQVTLAEAVRLALSRPLPAARLGLSFLRSKLPATDADRQMVLALVAAEAEPLRVEIVRWARNVLSADPHFQPEWLLEYLDSRHADVRAEGWAWLQEEPRARDHVELWRRLLESPYDDVRLKLVADLEKRVAQPDLALTAHVALDPVLLRFLWASVLLNIQRGGRTKPLVVQQLVRRLLQRPEDAESLLPILAVALRSLRGPEWRAGLAGVVQLVERNPDLEAAVRANFPELKV